MLVIVVIIIGVHLAKILFNLKHQQSEFDSLPLVDDTRVQLKSSTTSQTSNNDYINASFITVEFMYLGFFLMQLLSNDGNNCSIPPTLDGWVYIDPIHGPLDGPLYIWAQYTPTPPRSLNYRRSGVQDWTTRKLTPPPAV